MWASLSFMAIGKVYILKDVPFDRDYNDTILFESAGAQSGTLSGYAKYRFEDCSFTRIDGSVPGGRPVNTVSVPVVSENVMDCNYIMFQNTDYGSKWIYAFITGITFINPDNTRIEFEIDYFQTYITQFEVGTCLVVRAHELADTVFNNTVPEQVKPDWYKVSLADSVYFSDPYIVVMAAPNLIGNLGLSEAGIVNNVYTGTPIIQAPLSQFEDFNSKLKALESGVYGDVINIFMSPFGVSGSPTEIPHQFNFSRNVDTIDGYSFTNKKLLNYPFRYYTIQSTDSSQEVIIRPELMNDNHLSGTIYCCTTPQPSAVFLPDYAGKNQNKYYGVEYSEQVCCTWTTSTFSQWFSQNALSYGIKNIGSIFGSVQQMAAGFGTGNTGAMISGASGVSGGLMSNSFEQLSQAAHMAMLPDQSHGSTTASSNYAMGRIGFEVYLHEVNAKCAQRIDDYFTMYGYQQNSIYHPTLNDHEAFDYIKLADPIITGSIPNKGMEVVKKCFTNGIRLWHTTDVGNYTLRNLSYKEGGVKNDLL